MIRLVGVLTGASLAIALLLLVLGVPELGGAPAVDSRDVVVAAAPEAPPQPEILPGSPSNPLPAPIVEPDPEPATEPEPVAESSPEPVAESSPEPVAVAEPPVDSHPAPNAMTTDAATRETPAAQNWYAFWSPFNSRIAAEGFVSELSRTTGLDYRVVKLKPGVFEVAVAYTDDTDIEDKLTRISAATGLDMSGG